METLPYDYRMILSPDSLVLKNPSFAYHGSSPGNLRCSHTCWCRGALESCDSGPGSPGDKAENKTGNKALKTWRFLQSCTHCYVWKPKHVHSCLVYVCKGCTSHRRPGGAMLVARFRCIATHGPAQLEAVQFHLQPCEHRAVFF